MYMFIATQFTRKQHIGNITRFLSTLITRIMNVLIGIMRNDFLQSDMPQRPQLGG